MTYALFLAIFVAIPIVVLLAILLMRGVPASPRGRWIALAGAVQVVLALVYTTPWDNYLVYSGVWGYDPARVSGILLGYVPLEEYGFFVLESILVTVWWALLWRAPAPAPLADRPRLRVITAVAAVLIFACSAGALIAGWTQGNYLALILGWAAFPIGTQCAFGADILWRYRGLLAKLILPVGAYLSASDALAIYWGIWKISATQTTGLLIGNLPVEEALFFFVTVIMLAFGLTLSLAPEGRERMIRLFRK